MEKAGFTFQRLMEKLDELMNAQKPIAATVVHKAGKGKGAKDADETTMDFVDVPDNQVQIKALDMAFTLRDDYPCKKIKADVNHFGSIMAAVSAHLSKEQPPPKPPKEHKPPAKKVVYKQTSKGKKP
ncbi:MAG TPA: hypothetical protein VLH56_17315 [Dissulfurispiraceae bacterium]|nr:hypothetical protein [Dissulfurispiraceae bacterium]